MDRENALEGGSLIEKTISAVGVHQLQSVPEWIREKDLEAARSQVDSNPLRREKGRSW